MNADGEHTISMPFSTELLPKVNATTLKLGDPKTYIHLFEGLDAWSYEGKFLDVKTPEWVSKKAKSNPKVRTAQAESAAHVISQAKSTDATECKPLSWNLKVRSSAHTLNGLVVDIKKYQWIALKAENGVDAFVDPLYLVYFIKQYPGCTFFACKGSTSVEVRLGGETVGVIAQMKI